MKRKILKLFLVLIMLISFVGCGKNNETTEKEKEETKINNNDALLWKVESDTVTIYLAGSIHVGKEDTYPLQQKLLDAFNDSDALAVEVDVVAMQEDLEIMYAMLYIMMYDDGTTLVDNISEDTLKLFNEYVENYGIGGMGTTHIESLYMYKPWVLETLISDDLIIEAGMSGELGVDMYFLNEAKEKGMEIIEVESAESQFNMLDSYSPELQEVLLRGILETPREELIQELTEMLEMWENGDIEALEEYLSSEELVDAEDYTEEELQLYEQLYNEYNNAMIVERNILMTDKVEELLKGNKDVFYIVGSAHMVGEDGIIKLLQERGYSVNKL